MSRFKSISMKLLVALLIIVVLTFMASCSSKVLDADLVIEQQDVEMEVGETVALTVNHKELDDIVWRSSDSNVAVVDQLGEVKAVGPGTAVIIVKAGGKTATCKVAVIINYQLSPDSLGINPWETKQIMISPTPNIVSWKSENPDIAGVDSMGNVTGRTPGVTKVKALIGRNLLVCEVTVVGIAPERIVISIGETKQVQFLPTPDEDTVVWTSEDNGIAAVDQWGNVTAVGQGSTRVIAKREGAEAVCEVVVLPPTISSRKVLEVPIDECDDEPPTVSPDGSMYVGRVRGMFQATATLVDLKGNNFSLPGSGVGVVSWRGTKFVWHNLEFTQRDDDNRIVSQDIIYVYDSQDHTYTEIAVELPKSPIRLIPVLSSDSTVSVILPDGLWNYDLNQEGWTQVFTFQTKVMHNDDWPELIWSPDFKKVAWLEEGEKVIRLVLLDINSGSKNTIYQQPHLGSERQSKIQHVIHFAWSQDSTKLALSGGSEKDILILSPEGDVLKSFPFAGNMFSLTWVPGQDKIAYATRDGLVIRNVSDGNMGLVKIDVFHHIWLQDGNLAVISDTIMEIYEIDWENWND